MNILVTGAAGFIGFHLVKRLIKNGHAVVGVDNINSYYDTELKLARLAESGVFVHGEESYNVVIPSEKYQGYNFVKLRLEDKDNVFKLFNVFKFKYVIHLAAQAGVRYSIESPLTYIDSNATGFINIVEACRTFAVQHFIYASSSSVYGLNRKVPFSVSHPTDHPISLYAATKKANELMAHTYSHLYKLPSTGLRFFTVYGPWGRPDMAYYKFTKSIVEDKPIDVYNNGNMERDFTYVDDVVDGIIKVIPKIPEVKITKNGDVIPPYKIYNLGNNKPVKLAEFIKAIEMGLRKDAKKNFFPMQPGDVVRTWADIKESTKDFGYSPKIDIYKGIKDFVDWYLGYHNIKI